MQGFSWTGVELVDDLAEGCVVDLRDVRVEVPTFIGTLLAFSVIDIRSADLARPLNPGRHREA